MMNRTPFFTAVFLLMCSIACAQAPTVKAQFLSDNDFGFEKYTLDEIAMTSYNGDTSVKAVVLNEFGRTLFISNTANLRMQFEYHVKIKVLTDKGLSKGTVEIPLYFKDKGSYERLVTAEGVTHYRDESGKVQTVPFDAKQIQNAEMDEHHRKITFTLPMLRKGAVLEYKYTIESPYFDTLKTWRFQSDIPKLNSTYEIRVPQLFGYEVNLSGPLQLSDYKSAETKKCFYMNGISSDCLSILYNMKNIPAFTPQGLVSTKGILSAIYFQITDMFSVSNLSDLNFAVRKNISRDWVEFGRFLKLKDNFGKNLKKKFPLKNELAKITEGAGTDLDKAKAVYKYVQQNIKWNGYYGTFSDDEVKTIFERGRGSAADINMALITALNSAGIAADPVVLSTIDNGRMNREAPSLNDMNYVIATMNIGGKVYFADATEQNMDFGLLPARCRNFEGRVISIKSNDSWVDIP